MKQIIFFTLSLFTINAYAEMDFSKEYTFYKECLLSPELKGCNLLEQKSKLLKHLYNSWYSAYWRKNVETVAKNCEKNGGSDELVFSTYIRSKKNDNQSTKTFEEMQAKEKKDFKGQNLFYDNATNEFIDFCTIFQTIERKISNHIYGFETGLKAKESLEPFPYITK